MKQNNKGMVEIPAVTLNVLKKLVFDNDGINMSPVIDDLSTGLPEDKKDLLAIHVALTMKGLKPDLDIAKVSYKSCWRSIKVYIYQGFSLIQGLVSFKVFYVNWSPEEGWKVRSSYESVVLGLHQIGDDLHTTIDGLKMDGLKEDEFPDMDAFAEVVKTIPNDTYKLEA